MAHYIMCKNRKGGVGKTTLATHLSEGLSRRKYRVLSVDFDTQSNLKTSFINRLDENVKLTSGHLLVGDPKEIVFDDAVHKLSDELHIIVSDQGLQTVNKMLASERNGGVKKLEKVFKAHGIDKKYDFVIFDLPSEMNAISDTVTNITNLIIAPTTLDFDSVEGVRNLVDELADFVEDGVFESEDHVPSLLVVPMFFDARKQKRNKEHLGNLSELSNEFSDDILTSPIRTNIRFQDARDYGLTIYDIELDEEASKRYRVKKDQLTKGVDDVEKVIDRVLGELGVK